MFLRQCAFHKLYKFAMFPETALGLGADIKKW